ncbi:hypothetical protein COU15_00150 [Candidatus Kaiserbacteria bacterium CG10_big_fil_rev_8_21_14_0_10_45_20]|uniref:Uncharacterized protein n=1 Tax=Candidatus Kaiserbacteria bacterium CG10_big_fil_rev_8_21_14_0_10_45_20 TaxID=1974607 RepID=A0A2H0UGF6_9BACT|nr:MAG: hypothetical protein COU15_00150 [Candidatus Kaiserbacteria bacterium CG10_big_fil_rev_8_21_14_0_10_45_20]
MSQEFDFNSVPAKIYVDTAHIRVINGILHLALESGDDVECYTVPLPLAKLIGKAITNQVAEIEEKSGVTFDSRLPNEPVVSPWTSNKDDTKDSK